MTNLNYILVYNSTLFFIDMINDIGITCKNNRIYFNGEEMLFGDVDWYKNSVYWGKYNSKDENSTKNPWDSDSKDENSTKNPWDSDSKDENSTKNPWDSDSEDEKNENFIKLLFDSEVEKYDNSIKWVFDSNVEHNEMIDYLHDFFLNEFIESKVL